MTLEQLVVRSAQRSPAALAVQAPDGQLSYGELDSEANRLARLFRRLGVARGDRVGLWLDKSTRAVAAMQGVLRLGAAYVPLDPASPAPRVATIARDCGMRVVVSTERRRAELAAEPGAEALSIVCVDETTQGVRWDSEQDTSPLETLAIGDHELAYILYTSGSTGTPKGVCISQLNAMAFIEWAATELKATAEDRFSNHAPFFFDLSVLDLYVAFGCGASVFLVPEAMSFVPAKLVQFISDHRITVWYSVPSALILMQQAGLLERTDLALRAILFAGEPFPIKHLRPLRRAFSSARFLNLYGPTETNVCTFYEVHHIPEEQLEPVPIGKASCGDVARLERDPDEKDPDVGELVIEGPTVMLGYWGKPPQQGPYPTGDLVRRLPDGNYAYLGRRDNMLKVRGRRIEPGEIEAVLLRHPDIAEAAVVALGEGLQAQLVAALIARGPETVSLIALKQHCAKYLPRYMVVDGAEWLSSFPRTRNGKIDRRALRANLTAR